MARGSLHRLQQRDYLAHTILPRHGIAQMPDLLKRGVDLADKSISPAAAMGPPLVRLAALKREPPFRGLNIAVHPTSFPRSVALDKLSRSANFRFGCVVIKDHRLNSRLGEWRRCTGTS